MGDRRVVMDDEIFLNGSFQKYPECSKTYSVRLGRKNLIFEEARDSAIYTKLTDGFTSVLLQDVVAARLFNSKIPNDNSAYFQVVAFPLVDAGRQRKKRKKHVFTFRVNEADDPESNMVIAETWAKSIEWLIKNPSIGQEDLQIKETFPKKRRILVLINPKSGNGASLSKFRKFVEPIFKDAGIYFHEFVTKHASHAIDVAHSLNIADWEGIAICSGDGLAFEVIQGLMQRDDWEKAIKMPIGMIPTGSGNALCASVLYHNGDVFDITSAAFHVVRGSPKPIDLCSMQNDKQRVFAFLSLTWGIISDIDIESERLRLLGNARFTAGAVSRVLALRIYGGKLSFLPSPENKEDDNTEGNIEISEDESDLSSEMLETYFQDGTPASQNSVFKDALDYTKLDEEETVVNFETTNRAQRGFSTIETKPKTQEHFKRVLSANFGGGKYEQMEEVDDFFSCKEEENKNFDSVKPITKRAFSTNDVSNSYGVKTKNDVKLSNGMKKRPAHGPADSSLPSLGDDLPGEWVTEEGEFITVIISLISHLGSSLISCPGLGLGDGDMWLIFIRKGISRKSLVDFLAKMETGEHVKNKDVQIRKIKGFRLEPKFDRSGYIAVDGEVVEYDKIQGQIHKGLGRVFSCN